MLRHKRSYTSFLLILIFGALFSLAFSFGSISFQNRDTCLTVEKTKPGFNGGVGWVVGSSESNYGTILHTTNGGRHWVRQGSPSEIPNANFVSVIALDACNAWVSGGKADGYGVILRTKDGGRSWIRQGEKSQMLDLETSAVYAINKHIAWVVGGNGMILHTKDGGDTWTRQDQDNIPRYNLSGAYARDASHVWVVGSLTEDCGKPGDPYDQCGLIIRSKDSGKTWEQLDYVSNPNAPSGYLITVHGLNHKNLWVVGNGNVQQTTDGGDTWHDQTPGLAFYDFNGVAVVKKRSVWVTRDADGIYKYNGTDWETQTSPKNGFYNLRISALDSQTAWLAGRCRPPCLGGEVQGIIYHTADGGSTWQAQDPVVDTALWGVSFVRAGYCNPNR